MMKTLLKLICIIFCSLLSIISIAQMELQQHVKNDIIYFKGGGKLYGKILNIKHHTIEFEMITGKVVHFHTSVVKKIIQKFDKEGQAKLKFYRKRPYQFKEQGIYNTTYINLPQGYTDRRYYFSGSRFYSQEWTAGLGIHHVTGKQHNRWFGTGIGAGFDGYDPGSGKNILSLYGECRGYLVAKKFSPYYSVGLGYGFGIVNRNIGILENKGGLFFNPSVGYRFGGSAGANFVLGLGYKLQFSTITDRSRNGSFTTQKHQFNRLNTSFGLLF